MLMWIWPWPISSQVSSWTWNQPDYQSNNLTLISFTAACANTNTESTHFTLSLISCLILAAASIYLFLSLFSRPIAANHKSKTSVNCSLWNFCLKQSLTSIIQVKQYARIDVVILSLVLFIAFTSCLMSIVIWANSSSRKLTGLSIQVDFFGTIFSS